MSATPARADAAVWAAVFPGDSEMARRCRALDWAALPLGPVDGWPAALRAAVRLALETPLATCLWCGPAYVLLYNDAYRRALGAKHPAALGRPGAAVWAEAWAQIGPQLDGVRAGGPPLVFEDVPFVLERLDGGAAEDAWFTYTFVPVRDEAGAVVAIHNPVTETTARVRAEAERARLLAAERAARAAAEAEQQRLAAVVAHLPVGVTFADAPDGRHSVSNPAAVAIWGVVPASPEVAAYSRDFVGYRPGPGGRGSAAEAARRIASHEWPLARALAAGEVVADELAEIERPDGTRRLVSLSAAPVRDADGRVAGALVTTTDVTEREATLRALDAARQAAEGAQAEAEQARAAAERTAAALAGSEARFRTVQDASPHGLVLLWPVREGVPDAGVADPGRVVDFRIHYVNPAGARLTGQRPGAMVGHTLLELFPATRELGLFDAYVRVVETGVVWEDDVQYVADGLAAGYQLAAVRVGEGPEAELVLLYADATARLAAEGERERLLAALGVERERLRAALLQAMTPMALLVGPEHRLELVNDAYKRVSGGGRDVTGLTFREAFPELEGQPFFAIQDRVYATGEPWAASAVPVRYDRLGAGVEDAYFDLRYEPVRDGEGRVVALLNYGVDVTEQTRARLAAEHALRDAEAARGAAEAANRAKADFLAVMSHELRTPLNAIGGYAQLMELGLQGPVTPEQLAALGRIQRGQRHLLGLINAVLNYAKLEAGHVEYHPADVPAAEVLAEVAALVAPQARAKGLTVAVAPVAPETSAPEAGRPEVGAPRVGVAVYADPEKVRQVLLNLLSNAVKFTRAGGAGTLACAPAPGGSCGSQRVAFTVADTGRGITADQLARVFEPFVQVDQRLTRAEEGAGLGLAISRDLARGMGGDLTAESTSGVGSTFTLTLPAA